MSNLIQKITIRRKLNGLYRNAKESYSDVEAKINKHEVSFNDAKRELIWIINYTTNKYVHEFAVNGVLGVDIYNDKKFAKLLNTIKDKANNLNAELIKEQIKLGEKDNWKDTKENDACLNHLIETFTTVIETTTETTTVEIKK